MRAIGYFLDVSTTSDGLAYVERRNLICPDYLSDRNLIIFLPFSLQISVVNGPTV